MNKRSRIIAFIFLHIIALILICYIPFRIFRQFVPDGIDFPAVTEITIGSEFYSPDKTYFQVYYYDPGAAQSGNYWTWIVRSNLWTGKKVIASGFTYPDVRFSNKKFPFSFNGSTLSVEFQSERYEDQKPVIVRINLD